MCLLPPWSRLVTGDLIKRLTEEGERDDRRRLYEDEPVREFVLYDKEEVKPFYISGDSTPGSSLIDRLTREGQNDDDEGGWPGFKSIGNAIVGSLARYAGRYEDVHQALEIVAWPEKFLEQAKTAIQKGLSRCESPIERALLPWLVTQSYQFFDYNPAVLLPGETNQYKRGTLAIIPQLPIGWYRVDFALAAQLDGPIRFVVVECDGKEFHDGHARVLHDVNRDVAILKNPRVLDIIRIPGTDISRDPRKEAEKVARGVMEAWTKRK